MRADRKVEDGQKLRKSRDGLASRYLEGHELHRAAHSDMRPTMAGGQGWW